MSIMPFKVLDANGEGFSSDTVLAMEFALENGADVADLSLGSTYSSQQKQPLSMSCWRRSRCRGSQWQ